MEKNITKILNSSETEQIIPEVYNELTKLAHYALNKNQRHATLDTSAVVHESIIKFYNNKSQNFQSRGHFYALMSKVMRELIIDYIRKKNSQMRGGHLKKVTLSSLSETDETQEHECGYLLDMDNAMLKLEDFDADLAQLLIMKFYGGLKISELAECFETSESTIKRELRTARAFVKSQLT